VRLAGLFFESIRVPPAMILVTRLVEISSCVEIGVAAFFRRFLSLPFSGVSVGTLPFDEF